MEAAEVIPLEAVRNAGKANILLVDDQPENLVAVEALLQERDRNLVKASSGREALRCLLDWDFAVILLDVQMPVMDGFETATLIHERERSRATPIIFLTAALTSEEQVFRGYSVGAVDYMFKPFIPEILKAKVSVFVELYRAQAQLQRQAEELGEKEREMRRLADERALLLRQLEYRNAELEAFAYTVAHDLTAPLRTMEGFGQILLEEEEARLDDEGKKHLQYVVDAGRKMSRMVNALLDLSRLSRRDVHRSETDLSEVARTIADELKRSETGRQVSFSIVPGLVVDADPEMVPIILRNLIGNAWKFTARQPKASIEIGTAWKNRQRMFFVRDNGAGFDMNHAKRLFTPFQRLHSEQDFPGTGVGLATVYRVIELHGGRIWAEGEVGKGATVFFTL